MMKRAVSMLLIVVLLPHFTGCTVHRTDRVGPTDLERPIADEIVGVTTADGEEVEFDREYAATVANDSIYAVVDGERRVIPMGQVSHVWLKRTDAGASAAVTVLLVLGIAAVVVGVAAAIYAATKESCPFVYSWDGEGYVFDAEPYGGAITRGLERDDYSELEHLQADDGLYRLMITNEVQEAQRTNLAELWVVDHAPGARVVADQWGGLHTVVDPRPPRSARDHLGRDLLTWLRTTDRRIWEPEAVADAEGRLRQDIVLSFAKPNGATEAKLVANVANSLWGSYMIKQVLDLWGREVDSWYASLDGAPEAAEAVRAWNRQEELYELKIYVEEQTGWVQRGTLLGGGPFIAEDRVVPLDLSGVVGDELRIRIQPPYGYWALNSFAVDYGADRAVRVDTVAPLAARDHQGHDVLASLVAVDESYYEMPSTGDYGYLTFAAPESRAGMERTVFLHTRGFYRLYLSEEGDPDLMTIERIFGVPGAVLEFAAARYADWRTALAAR